MSPSQCMKIKYEKSGLHQNVSLKIRVAITHISRCYSKDKQSEHLVAMTAQASFPLMPAMFGIMAGVMTGTGAIFLRPITVLNKSTRLTTKQEWEKQP